MEVDPIEKPSPSKKSDVVRVDIFSLNGKAFDFKFLGKDVKELWKSLKHDPDNVIGQSSSKINKNTLRVNIQLRSPIALKDVSPTQDFTFERATVFKNYTFECRVVGLGNVREARIGDTITVCIKRGHFRFKPEEATAWISVFGKILAPLRYLSSISNLLPLVRVNLSVCVTFCLVSSLLGWVEVATLVLVRVDKKLLIVGQSCLFEQQAVSLAQHSLANNFYQIYNPEVPLVPQEFLTEITAVGCSLLISRLGCMRVCLCELNFIPKLSSHFNSYEIDNEGLRTETIKGEIELKEQIPEWLPMFGCRVRVYYHGQPTQCNTCWEVGHQAKACTGQKLQWKQYIQKLAEDMRFPREIFGTWLDEQPGPSNRSQEDQIKEILGSGIDLRKLVDILKNQKKPNNQPKVGEKKKGRPKGATAAKGNANAKKRKVQED